MSRRFLYVFVVLALLLVGQVPVSAQTAPGTSLDKSFQREITGETSKYVVEFEARASLADAYDVSDFAARGQFVMDRLEATADAAQADVIRVIKATNGASFESFWLRNVVVFEGDQELADTIAAMPGVREVRPEKTYQIDRPVETHQAEPAEGVEWGVDRIGAPAVWEQGILGSGIVVGSLDSGVDYLHPAIVEKYRGNNHDGTFTHDYNWFDASGDCPTSEPCDLLGHGTHTMGTMVGGDGPGPFMPDIGVAPGAQWMTVSCGPGFCSESQLMAAGQFFIAPTDLNGENPDPSKRPDIVNNSWGGPPGDPFFVDMVEAWRAAGIVPVFSSGNPGPFCGEGGSPGDYLAAYSVGATDIEDIIAEFSGRGPSAFGKINPDVSAPGVDVVSSVPGGGYEAFSGTSMAAPHVVGTLALLMSAAPDLIGDVDGATGIVSATAMDIIDLECGGDDDGDPNNVYGEGRIDAAAAVALAATGGTLEGTVRDAGSGDPIAGARVAANNGIREFGTTTDGAGHYRLFLQEGSYTVTASAFAYEMAVVPGVAVIQDATTTQDLALEKLPTGVVTGRVFQANDGSRIVGATVEVLGVPVEPVKVGRSGVYAFELPVGFYTLRASQGGCTSTEFADVAIVERGRTIHDFGLVRKIDDFGYGCSPIRFQWKDATTPDSLWFDDTVGRLPLPFDFPFYGENHRQVFITTNGYLTFDLEFFSEFFNSAIPSADPPNNAVYALWQDLWVDEDAQVSTSTVHGQSWTLQYENISPLGGSANVDMQIKLYKSGRIDLLYGDGVDEVGNGSSATVGIEAPDGRTGLQYSFREPVLRSGEGIRFEVLPTGFAAGTVTNANDGLPVQGATITAEPSGRSTTTATDGTYELRLLPGDYELTAEGRGYETETKPATIVVDHTTAVDFSLRAPVITVVPDAVAATVDLGDTAIVPLEVRNDGSAPLVWAASGIQTGAVPPELPPVMTAAGAPYLRNAEWARPDLPPELLTADVRVADPTFEGPLDTIIEDPLGDAVGVDVVRINGGADDVEASLEIEIAEGNIFETVGFVFLDTDQDPATGLPAEALDGLPTQDVGMEYFIDLFLAPEGFVLLVDAEVFEVIAELPVEFTDTSMRFDIPLEAIGDDGVMNVAAVIGDFEAPRDWVPDIGHGELSPGRAAPWIGIDPADGLLAAGESATVNVALGGFGIDPGIYEGEVRFDSNDPRTPRLKLPAMLEVLLPADFGAVEGVVSDAFFGDPVGGALVEVLAEVDGAPFAASTTTGDDGTFRLFLPAGEWPMTTTAEGYQPNDRLVEVTAGAVSFEAVELIPFGGIAEIDFGDMSFTLGPDTTETRSFTLSNVGNLEMPFSVLEFEAPDFARTPTAAYPANVTSANRPAGTDAIVAPVTVTRDAADGSLFGRARGARLGPYQPTNGEGLWLVLMDALPWDSEALFFELDANGIAYDVAPSDAMGDIPLVGYDVVIVANDQPQVFYDRYNENVGWFEDYVLGGGVLWVGAASLGFNGGAFDGGVLPGGAPIIDELFEDLNDVLEPDHPLMADVPNPFEGTSASHDGFDGVDILPGATVIAVGSFEGFPTLIEYSLGAGTVVASSQPMEFGWETGQPSGQILINMIPYLGTQIGPPPDVPWLSVDPAEGLVDAGDSVVIEVTVDTTGLEPGLYGAELFVIAEDLFGSSFTIPVTLEVTPMT